MSQAAEPVRWRDLIGVVVPLLAFLSVLAYGIARISYERFYGQFGLAPDDVGASSTRVLGESGAHLIVYSVLFAIIPYSLSLLTLRLLCTRAAEPVRRRLQIAPKHATTVPLPPADSHAPAAAGGTESTLAPRGSDLAFRLLASRAARTLAWCLFVTLLSLLPLALYQRVTGGGFAGGYVGVSALGLIAIACWTQWPNASQRPRWSHVALVWLSLGLLWVNLFYVPSAASRAARCVANNGLALQLVHTRRHLPGMKPPAVLGLRAQPTTIAWLGAGAKPPANLIFLGRNNSTDFFFSPKTKLTYRLPENELELRTPVHQKACPELSRQT